MENLFIGFFVGFVCLIMSLYACLGIAQLIVFAIKVGLDRRAVRKLAKNSAYRKLYWFMED